MVVPPIRDRGDSGPSTQARWNPFVLRPRTSKQHVHATGTRVSAELSGKVIEISGESAEECRGCPGVGAYIEAMSSMYSTALLQVQELAA